MAVNDKLTSSNATAWYNNIKSVVNNYGPGGSTVRSITLNSADKTIGNGAGQSTLWLGTAPENMTITTFVFKAYTCTANGGSARTPNMAVLINGSEKATMANTDYSS